MHRVFGMMAAMVVSAGSLQAQQAMMAAPTQAAETVTAAPQVKDDLFAGTEMFATGATDVSDVNLDQNTLGLVGGKGKHGDMVKKLDFVVVHSYTYDKPGKYRMADLEVFRQKLASGNWSCIVHEQTKTEATDVCVRQGADHESNELVVIAAEPKELTFVHLKGRMSLAELESMKDMGAPGTPTPPEPPLKTR